MSKVITRSEHFVEIDEVEYEIRLEPEHGTDIEHRKLDDGRMVIGYLIHDDDCSNPLEDCDGMGHIHSFSRRHMNNISPDDVPGMKHSEYAVPLSYFEHGLCKWGVAGSMSGMPDFQWDGVGFAGVWLPDKYCIDEIKRRAPVYSFGKIVEMQLRGPSRYHASTKHKSQSFQHWHEAFDWLRKQTKRKTATKQGVTRAAEELAANACDQYTKWCNGECYGVIVVTCEADGTMIDSDECWGYIGHEYAEQTMKEQMDAVK